MTGLIDFCSLSVESSAVNFLIPHKNWIFTKIHIMKFASAITSTLILASSAGVASAQCDKTGDHTLGPLEYNTEIGFKVDKVGSVETSTTAAWTYNMYAADNFDGDTIFFLDQAAGKIFSYDTVNDVTEKIFDISTSDIPAGLSLDWDYAGAAQKFKVHAMSQGPDEDEVIVVLQSSTLPEGWDEADGKLPAAGAFGLAVCENFEAYVEDIYRLGTVPDCFNNGGGIASPTNYDVFYKYTFKNGALTDPKPFFVAEISVNPGHLGGGITTMPNGNLLYSPGDCTFFGIDGRYAPQLDDEWCGKIHVLYPNKTGKYKTVAKGVRNPQQMRLYKEKNGKSPKGNKGGKKTKAGKLSVAFMDIGGVTAEEVNSFNLGKLLQTKDGLTNFGWGRNIEDGKAREGVFYVENGIGGILGTQPPCMMNAEIGEEGYVQPWIQFGRTAEDFFYAISSMAIPSTSDDVELLWTEFNTGILMGTPAKAQDPDDYTGPATAYKYKLFDSDGTTELSAFNDLVQKELGDVGYYRGDARLFHYPDGSVGVFIERTGVFYKLTQVAL